MAITYEWKVKQLECYPQYETQSNVVFTVHWTCTGVDGSYTSGVYGACVLSLDNLGENFTNYEDLTEAQVIGWVHASMGALKVTQYETIIATQIAAEKNPQVITPELPW